MCVVQFYSCLFVKFPLFKIFFSFIFKFCFQECIKLLFQYYVKKLSVFDENGVAVYFILCLKDAHAKRDNNED